MPQALGNGPAHCWSEPFGRPRPRSCRFLKVSSEGEKAARQDRVRFGSWAGSVRFSIAAVVLISALLAGCGVVACDQTADRFASIAADGISSVRIIAEAGSLDIEGRLNQTDVNAEGTACASSSNDLEEIQFEVTTSGSEVVIEARTPGSNSEFDLTITVPDSVLVEVEDNSGGADIHDVADVRIRDDSGDVDVANVSGDVTVTEDGSGNLNFSGIAGSVEIAKDGSGEIIVTDVGGDVLVGEDGSGSIDVTNVAGDFVVRQGGSGGIDHSGIGGTVDIPED